MLDQLSASLHKISSPDSGTKNPMKTADMHLKPQFWTQSKSNEWTNTPGAHTNARYKFAFIEDKQGNGVSDSTLKAIWKTMAPKSWGKANASTKELIYSLMYQVFHFFS